ncbi:hypothetical protein BHE74_00028855 [Ensete ventricosum]|nr:hypothetical protein BHE74_00028855 [Ensete ventricosum]
MKESKINNLHGSEYLEDACGGYDYERFRSAGWTAADRGKPSASAPPSSYPWRVLTILRAESVGVLRHFAPAIVPSFILVCLFRWLHSVGGHPKPLLVDASSSLTLQAKAECFAELVNDAFSFSPAPCNCAAGLLG